MKWYRCECYFNHNIFLPQIEKHVKFISPSQFLSEYQKLFSNQSELDKAMEDAQAEVSRRQQLIRGIPARMTQLNGEFIPRQPELYKISENHFDPEFLRIFKSVNEGVTADDSQASAKETLSKYLMKPPRSRLYHFPLFTADYCNRLKAEVRYINSLRNRLPIERPNTMNRYGILLNDFGFKTFFDELTSVWLKPIFRVLYPEWFTEEADKGCIDSQRSFTVRYQAPFDKRDENDVVIEGDESLAWHYDNAELTANVALMSGGDVGGVGNDEENDEFGGGEVIFGHMNGDREAWREGKEAVGVGHRKGWVLIHRGRQLHSSLPLEDGERENVIIWMRSSAIRNRQCPMCQRTAPEFNLIPTEHPEDTGDGFTGHHSLTPTPNEQEGPGVEGNLIDSNGSSCKVM